MAFRTEGFTIIRHPHANLQLQPQKSSRATPNSCRDKGPAAFSWGRWKRFFDDNYLSEERFCIFFLRDSEFSWGWGGHWGVTEATLTAEGRKVTDLMLDYYVWEAISPRAFDRLLGRCRPRLFSTGGWGRRGAGIEVFKNLLEERNFTVQMKPPS